MADRNSVKIQISAEGAAKTLKDLAEINKQLNALRSGKGGIGGSFDLPNADKARKSLTGIAFGFNEITAAAQQVAASVGQVYDLLIGQNERLQQQILRSAATIATTSAVSVNDVLIENSTEVIQRLQPVLKAAIKEVEIATQQLVGVTSAQTSEVFNSILAQSGQLTNQSKQFENSIDAAVALAPGLVATLGALDLPLAQSSQEIRDILQGTIGIDTQIAKSLGITSAQVKNWKAQGILVDELVKKFEPFVAANAIAARSIGGLTSNIQDIVEIIGRTAGAPLLTVLVDQLDVVYKLLVANQAQISDVAVEVVGRLGEVINTAIQAINGIIALLQPSLVAIGAALEDSFGAAATTVQTTIENLANIVGVLVQAATPLIQLVSALTQTLAQLADTPAGQALIQLGLGFAAVNTVLPNVVKLFGIANVTLGTLTAQTIAASAAQKAFVGQQVASAAIAGTTAKGLQAQLLGVQALQAGNLKLANSFFAVSAAQKAQFAAGAASLGQFALFAAAIAAVAAAVQTFQELSEPIRSAEENIAKVNAKLLELDQLSQKVASSNRDQAASFASIEEQAKKNDAAIRGNLSGIQKFLDGVRGFINELLKPFAIITQLAPVLKEIFPSLSGPIDELTARIEGLQSKFPQLGTAADSLVAQTNDATRLQIQETSKQLAEIDRIINQTLQPKVGDALNSRLKAEQQKLLDLQDQLSSKGASASTVETDKIKAQIDATKANIAAIQDQKKAQLEAGQTAGDVIDGQIAALRNLKTTNPEDLAAINRQIDAFKQRKRVIDETTGSIDINAKALVDQGTLAEQVARESKQAFDALYGEDAAAPADQQAADQFARTAQQRIKQEVELGAKTRQIAQEQLQQIVNDNRLSADVRQSALQELNSLEQDSADKQVEIFKKRRAEIDILQAKGLLTDSNAELAKTKIVEEEAAAQLQTIRNRIAAEEEAIKNGAGSRKVLESLRQQEVQQSATLAQSIAATQKAVEDQRIRAIESASEKAATITKQAETDRLITIQSLLNQGVISEREANELKVQSTIETTKQQLAAEEDRLNKLRALPATNDPDVQKDREKQIQAAITQTGQLRLQLLEQERQAQEAVRQRALEAIKDQEEALARALERSKAQAFEITRAFEQQNNTLQGRVNTIDLASRSLETQKSLLSAQLELTRAIQESQLAGANNQVARIQESIDLYRELKTTQEAGVVSTIKGRLQELGIIRAINANVKITRAIPSTITPELAALEKLENAKVNAAKLELQQTLEILSLQRQQAEIEAKQNLLSQQRSVTEAAIAANKAKQLVLEKELAVAEAQNAQNRARLALDEAQQITDPQQRSRAVSAAERGISEADRNVKSAQDQLDVAREGSALADQNKVLAEQQAAAATEIAKKSAETLEIQQKAAEQQARQAADSAIFAANLDKARASAELINKALGPGGGNEGGGIPGRRTGGPVEGGQLYQVHQDELIVPQQSGYVLNRMDALRAARDALSVPNVEMSASGRMGNGKLLRAIESLASGGGGIKTGPVYQSITNQLPREDGALARKIEQANYELLQQLRRRLG